ELAYSARLLIVEAKLLLPVVCLKLSERGPARRVIFRPGTKDFRGEVVVALHPVEGVVAGLGRMGGEVRWQAPFQLDEVQLPVIADVRQDREQRVITLSVRLARGLTEALEDGADCLPSGVGSYLR